MMSSEMNSAGPTSCADSITTLQWSLGEPSAALRSMCLWRFSTMTIAASIIAPMAMAIPPRLMMFALRPSSFMESSAMRMPMGRVTMATSALFACRRKITVTSATMIDSSSSFPFSVAMARSISPDRS